MGTYQQLHLDCQVWREEGGGTKVVGEGKRVVTRERQEGMKGEKQDSWCINSRSQGYIFDL